MYNFYKKLRFFFLILLFWQVFSVPVWAQYSASGPMVKNFPKQIYNGGTQTWDICEGDNGLIFFANNDGLLLFDGKSFSKFPLPGKTILRSIYFDKISRRIFAGGQNEIGYFEFEKNGKLKFVSLAYLLPVGFKGFEDVWGIEETDGKFFFQTSQQLLVYDGTSISILKPSEFLLENIYKVQSNLYLTDASGTIFQHKAGTFQVLVKSTNLDISSLLPFGSDILISTFKNGLFVLKSGLITKLETNDELLKRSRIYKACTYGSNYLLASNRSGIFFLDSTGRVFKNISLEDGLQNSNTLSLFKDANNNVWLGLDNGIDLVRLNYPFGYILPDGLLKGTGYSMTEFGGNYYFGTNNGLYTRTKTSASVDAFRLVSNTEGQVWWVQTIHNKLYVSHHEGLFEVEGTNARRISEIRGCWKLIELNKHPGYYVMGTYSGLSLFKWLNGSLSFVGNISRFKESSRFLEEDESGRIWVGHPYKGVYRIQLSPDLLVARQVKLYGVKDGLPEATENYVFSTDLGLGFCTPKGIFKYRENTDKFELFRVFSGLIDSSRAYKRLISGKNGNIWYIGLNDIGFLKPVYNGVEYSYTKVPLPKLDQSLVGGFEFLNECDDGNLFLGVESGFVHLNLKHISKFTQELPTVLVTSIGSLSFSDSIYSRYLLNNHDIVEINDRSIEFSFSSTNAYFYKDLSFSSYLEGWDKTWSAWKPVSTREFSRLTYGDYQLKVKAKYMGLEGPETIIRIHIPAPWYWTRFAKFFYGLIAIILVVMIGFYPQMRVRKKASRILAEKDDHFKRQTEILRLEKEKQEKELIELKNQQLQRDLEHQGKELASSTMHIVQKSEMLLTIKDKLKRISQISNDPKIKPEITELIKNIEKDTLIDKDWEKFEIYFNNIHDRFTQILKEKFPILTANDIKMCAYLRMNLSTKEIASILNISVRGVEISRYRLRKKMNLENGINLTEYLSKL
ncbi:MAG: LuxR C-terminal-related transcriptional regulator [Bacteroidia bacterium]